MFLEIHEIRGTFARDYDFVELCDKKYEKGKRKEQERVLKFWAESYPPAFCDSRI